MSKYLVIVESPTKAKTINSILGKDYEVTSSMGHVVDLPAGSLSVDVENDFEPKFKTIPGKEKILSELKAKAKNKDIVYIATDPDREGEAIGWHIQEKLAKDVKVFQRVTFHEITAEALKESFAKPGKIDMDLVNSQIARRVLDRIVGYNLSPLLWKKIVRGLSAGRVQSVALKFITEREKEIRAFIPKTTYTVEARFKIGGKEFSAELDKFKGKKAVFDSREEALACIDEIKKQQFSIKSISKKEVKRNPLPPYTTSLLQQDAFNKLRFASSKTMMVAQKLYEGIEINGEAVGLITYMRTDSFNISDKAKIEVKGFISKDFGSQYLPVKDHKYKEKKGAQMAHEAIRPSSVLRKPEDISSFLDSDGQRLYELIWKRFTASFMKEAVFEQTKAVIASQDCEFSADGRRLIFDGFLRVWGKEENEVFLPEMKANDPVLLEASESSEHISKPPARFNDASLVKLMEEKGIGRPSTYAPTIYTLAKRNYMRREKGYFAPTDLGMKVTDLLVNSFKEVINEDFTADMEEKLDEVEEGKVEWHHLLADFFPSFKKQVDDATLNLKKEVIAVSDKTCPKCGAHLVLKWSRKGKFLSCSKFPECRYGESITTDVVCPECKEGKLIERRNKKGQFFYGCSKFPACRFTSRRLPTEKTEEKSENQGPVVAEQPPATNDSKDNVQE